MQTIDGHTVAAAKMFGIATADVTPKQRREAKAWHYKYIYGVLLQQRRPIWRELMHPNSYQPAVRRAIAGECAKYPYRSRRLSGVKGKRLVRLMRYLERSYTGV